MGFTCPVCGYPGLAELPWNAEGGASDEICPSCGIQFGYDDDATFCGEGNPLREKIYSLWRQKWIDAGMRWQSVGIAQPKDWRLMEQLRNVGG